MVRRLAIRSALSAKAGDGELKVIRGLELDAPRTKTVAALLGVLEMSRSALLVTAQSDRNLLLSSRNLPGAKALPADYLNVADLLSHHGLLMTEEAVRRAEAIWGGDRASKRLAPVPVPEVTRG
jgi:large subunit ribosomal protein L4